MKNMLRTPNALYIIAFSLLCLFPQGCVTKKTTPWYNYFERQPISIAVVPSEDATEHPDAPVIFTQACEKALAERGFVVISADAVVSYASASGLLLADLRKMKASKIGKDLKADMVLFNNISAWDSKFRGLNTKARVAGTYRLVESATDATIDYSDWAYEKNSGSGGGGIGELLIRAVVSSVVNSATDACASLGEMAARGAAYSFPTPGIAPPESKPLQTPPKQ